MRNTNIIMLGSLSKGKIKEYSALFKEWPEIEFKSLPDIVWNVHSFQEVENGKTYYENAYAKGQLSHFAAKVPTIADDTGLEVDALGGRPGLHSHRFAELSLKENQNISQDEANLKKLLSELKGVPFEKRTAKFVCTLVFFVEGVVLSATDTLEGNILETPRGSHGFGYDSIFLVKGTDKTLAEMTMAEKNKISHRAKALRKLMTEIRNKNVQLVRP